MPASLTPPEPDSPAQPQAGQPTGKPWVQSLLAIATGYLFLALGIFIALGLLADTNITALTTCLRVVIPLACATAGGYITSLLAPSKPIKHGLGLLELTFLLWLGSAILSPSALPWRLNLIFLAIALIGISTGTWLRHRQLQP